MFLAGLELDLDEFKRNRRPALTFGALTFSIPFFLGLLLVLPFGYGLATAALYGSLWASHTLVTYPIVQEHGLTRQHAVGMAAGGTVITDTLALFVLAVVVGSVETDGRSSVIVLKLVLGLGLLVAYCAALTRVGRWVFARLPADRVPRFLVLLAGMTPAALVAHLVGLEGIVGAFFAGLPLNRLVPAGSTLMEGVEFIGAVLLNPFFLLSTGMLLDPGQFTEVDVLLIAGASLAVVLAGKATASYFGGRYARLGRTEVRLLFGLTIAQAAAHTCGGDDRHRSRHLRPRPAQLGARGRARDRGHRRRRHPGGGATARPDSRSSAGGRGDGRRALENPRPRPLHAPGRRDRRGGPGENERR